MKKILLTLSTTSAFTLGLNTTSFLTINENNKSNINNNNLNLKSNSNNFDIVDNKNIFNSTMSDNLVSFAVSSNNDIYYSLFKGLYVLKSGETTPTKILDYGIISKITISTNGDVYFYSNNDSNNGFYVLKKGETTPTKILSQLITATTSNTSGDVYFSVRTPSYDNDIYLLKSGETTPTKILNIHGDIECISLDNKDNIYYTAIGSINGWNIKTGKKLLLPSDSHNFRKVVVTIDGNVFGYGNDGIFVFKSGSDKFELLVNAKSSQYSNDFPLQTNSNGDLYYSDNDFDNGQPYSDIYVLKSGETTPTKIISNKELGKEIGDLRVSLNGDLYYVINSSSANFGFNYFSTALSWTKRNTKINLFDQSKTLYWLSNNQIVTNDKLHIEIKNNLINDVKVNGQIKPQTNKVWTFDISTEKIDFDSTIDVNFTVNDKNYQSEIVVSSLLTVPNISVTDSATGGIIEEYQGVLSINKKVGNIPLTSSSFFNKSEIILNLNKPTPNTKTSGIIFGINKNWAKNGESQDINLLQSVHLDGSQLNAYQGRYLVETVDSANNKQDYYLVVSSEKDNKIINFWNINEGQYFLNWASINGYDQLKVKNLKSVALNNVIQQSVNWNKKLATDQELVNEVKKYISENATISVSDSISEKELIKKLNTFIPKTINIKNEYTNTYDSKKVNFEISSISNNQEFKPNEVFSITVLYNNIKASSFNLKLLKLVPDSKKTSLTWIWFIVAPIALVLIWILLKFRILPNIKMKKHTKKINRELENNTREDM